jgi:hypothetical protein
LLTGSGCSRAWPCRSAFRHAQLTISGSVAPTARESRSTQARVSSKL